MCVDEPPKSDSWPLGIPQWQWEYILLSLKNPFLKLNSHGLREPVTNNVSERGGKAGFESSQIQSKRGTRYEGGTGAADDDERRDVCVETYLGCWLTGTQTVLATSFHSWSSHGKVFIWIHWIIYKCIATSSPPSVVSNPINSLNGEWKSVAILSPKIDSESEIFFSVGARLNNNLN